MWQLVGLFFIGLFAGLIARLLVRSPTRLGCLGTALLGVIGSYAGGSLYSILFQDDFNLRKASTFIGAVIGSVLLLVAWRAVAKARR